MQPIDTDRDRMPPEVAVEMLCDPKVKLTNKDHKMCMRARETVYPSARPIVRPMRRDPDTGKLEKLPYEYDRESGPTDRTARKIHEATFSQLAKWRRRLVRHRTTVQRLWEKARMTLENAKDPATCHALRRLMDRYEGLVGKVIDPKLDKLDTELETRTRSRGGGWGPYERLP